MAVVTDIVTHNGSAGGAEAANVAEGSLFRGGKLKRVPFSFAVAAGDSDTSKYPFAELPVNARGIEIKLLNDAITTLDDMDIGVYKVLDGKISTVVSKDCIADGLDLTSARTTTPLDITPVVEKIGKKLWEIAGESVQPVDPTFFLVFTANTAGTVVGDIGGFVYFNEN